MLVDIFKKLYGVGNRRRRLISTQSPQRLVVMHILLPRLACIGQHSPVENINSYGIDQVNQNYRCEYYVENDFFAIVLVFYWQHKIDNFKHGFG